MSVTSALAPSTTDTLPMTNTMRKDQIKTSTEEKFTTGQLFIDEERQLSKSTFPIKPDELVHLTKEILANGLGAGKEAG